MTPLHINNGALEWKQKELNKISDEHWDIVMYDDIEGYYFDEYGFKDQISYIKQCIKKSIKYFKEYNIEMDDNEDIRTNFIENL